MKLHNTREPVLLENSDISDSSILNVAMARTTFNDVNLKGSTFTNVNLSGITLDDVNLSDASISNANLAGARINGVLIQDLFRAYRAAPKPDDVANNNPGAVLYAKDAVRLHRFYESALGFVVTRADKDFAVLQLAGFQLTVVQTPAHIAEAIIVAVPPERRENAPIKVVVVTPSIELARSAIRAHGGDLLPPEREWDFDGHRVCDGHDSEGNIFQLRETRG